MEYSVENAVIWDRAYWLSMDPERRKLDPNVTQSEARRGEIARELAERGYIIDVPIMVWGWGALATMTLRKNFGYTWVPSALQSPVSVAPGLSFPGAKPYDPANPPEGSILVSTDLPKPYNQPVVEAPITNQKLVGGHCFEDLYWSLPEGNLVPNGKTVVQDGASYVKKVVAGGIGVTHFFRRLG